MGISQTKSQQERKMAGSRTRPTQGSPLSHPPSSRLVAKLPQKSALAGVGRPMKVVVCRSSKLNLANRNAENGAMRKAR